jgi:hypothetical protein
MSLSEALVGLKAYKEVDQRMALLWHSIDDAIVGPRTIIDDTHLPGVGTQDVGTRGRFCEHPLIYNQLAHPQSDRQG